MTRVRLRRVPPEQNQQLVTAAPLRAGRGKHSEQCQSATRVPLAAEERVVLRAGERERPERPKTKAIGAGHHGGDTLLFTTRVSYSRR